MTIPLIVLLVALGLFVLLGFGLVALGLFGNRDDDASFALASAGLIVAALACGCIAAIAYHSDGPACRLSPSSLVERAP